MPLLDILGVDGLNQGFTVGVAFIYAEIEEGCNWAITHLKTYFNQEFGHLLLLQIAMRL
jgi:hypothetical protein